MALYMPCQQKALWEVCRPMHSTSYETKATFSPRVFSASQGVTCHAVAQSSIHEQQQIHIGAMCRGPPCEPGEARPIEIAT
eukprot:5598907-Amphidinium_carterae.1